MMPRWVPLVEQELLPIPEHILSSLPFSVWLVLLNTNSSNMLNKLEVILDYWSALKLEITTPYYNQMAAVVLRLLN
jgi:hypothetical protein